MAGKYDGLARIIIQNVGGKSNISGLRNCRKIKLPFILTNYNISITMFLSHSGG